MRYIATEIGNAVAALTAGEIVDVDHAKAIIFELAVHSARDKHTAYSIGELAGHCCTLTEDALPYRTPDLATSWTAGFHHGDFLREDDAAPPATTAPPQVQLVFQKPSMSEAELVSGMESYLPKTYELFITFSVAPVVTFILCALPL